jgi:hypothetical protein
MAYDRIHSVWRTGYTGLTASFNYKTLQGSEIAFTAPAGDIALGFAGLGFVGYRGRKNDESFGDNFG